MTQDCGYNWPAPTCHAGVHEASGTRTHFSGLCGPLGDLFKPKRQNLSSFLFFGIFPF